MADNFDFTPGTGATGAADEIGGVKYPRVKTTWGPDGTANDADVATGKPLPVQLRGSDGTDRSNALPTTVADGGNATLGAKADAAATATDTTAITAMSVWKQISKTLQAAVGAATTALFSKVTDGTNTAAVKAASTAPQAADPALVVSLSPNSVNANGQATMANSSPVVIASNQSAVPISNSYLTQFGTGYYVAVAASQTGAVLQSSTGAAGDYLEGVLVIPATTAPGVVDVLDNATTLIAYPGGGTTALLTLTPFYIPVGAVSRSGAWKITTGANVSVLAMGKFS